MATYEFSYYVDDGEGWLSVDERLRRARDAYLVEKKAHQTTKNEVELLRERVAPLEWRLIGSVRGQGGDIGQRNEGLSARKTASFDEVSTVVGEMSKMGGEVRMPLRGVRMDSMLGLSERMVRRLAAVIVVTLRRISVGQSVSNLNRASANIRSLVLLR